MDRDGSERDVEKLNKLLTDMEFSVQLKEDLTQKVSITSNKISNKN